MVIKKQMPFQEEVLWENTLLDKNLDPNQTAMVI